MEALTTERNNIYNNSRTDKKIAGIIRWLERCRNSYKSGAIESALMDAECARADLEDLRKSVWSKVDDKVTGRRFSLVYSACVIISTVLLVMLTAAPVARDINFVNNINNNIIIDKNKTTDIFIAEKNKKIEKIAVKSIEKNDITGKNIDIKNNNSLKNNLKAEKVEAVNNDKAKGAGNVKPVRAERLKRPEKVLKAEVKEIKDIKDVKNKEVKAIKEVKAVKTEKIVPYDKMFSLLETGARALRNETPVIEIK